MFVALVRIGLAIGLIAATAGEKPKGKKLVVTNKPLTVKVELTAESRAGLTAAAKSVPKVVVTLVIKGVVPPEEQDQIDGILVFLNKDNATSDTSADDPHFVAAFAFPPTDHSGPYGLNLDLTRTVGALGRRGELDPTKPLRVTLVADPSHGVENLPTGLEVSIGSLSVETASVE